MARSYASEFDATVLSELNQIRATHGLAALSLDPALDGAASAHSRQMLADGYFSHNSADGGPFWRRIESYDPATLQGASLGENLFWSSMPATPALAVSAWMASPKHRANILNPQWRLLGIGALTSPDAPGVFGQRAVMVITTDFATNG